MCVLALAINRHPRWPLLLAGNRDEFHARPTAALAPWSDAPLLGGRDLRAGGGWLASDGRGRLAVVTNVRDPAARQDGPSRGALVAGFLATDCPAATYLDRLQAGAAAYAPFNLLLADAGGVHWLGNHPPARRQLGDGLYGLSNAALDSPWPKSVRLRDALGQWLAAGTDGFGPLWAALADRRQPPDAALPDTGVGAGRERFLAPVFIAGDDYGTRASTIVAIAADGSGFIAERRFGPAGVPAGRACWRFDGAGRFAPGST